MFKNMTCQSRKKTFLWKTKQQTKMIRDDTISSKNKNRSRSKLIDVCRTRWVARIDGMGQFEKLLPYVVGALEKMHLNKKNVYNRETSAKAGSHFYLFTSFKFIATLVIGRRVLDYLGPITTQLQKLANDILCGLGCVISITFMIYSPT